MQRVLHRSELDGRTRVCCRRTVGGCQNLAQPFVLLLAVGQYEQAVSLYEIVVERTAQQSEVFVEQGLGGCVETDGGIGNAHAAVAGLHETETGCSGGKVAARAEPHLLAHGVYYVLALHLRCALQPLGHGLLRKAFVVDAPHTVLHIGHILGHKHGVFGQKVEQRHLVGRLFGQFGHNLHAVSAVARQLRAHVEGAYGVHIVAEKVYTERIFAAERIDIKYAAAHGKLARLIHVVGFLEVQTAQRAAHLGHVHGLPLAQLQRATVEPLARNHQFGHSLRISHHIERPRRSSLSPALCTKLCAQPTQRLGAKYLVGGVALGILHRTAIGRGEKQHIGETQNLGQIVIEIAGFVGILQYEQRCLRAPCRQSGERHRCGRGHKTVERHRPYGGVAQRIGQSPDLRELGIQILKFLYIHLENRATVVQTSGKKTRFQFPECSLPYAKVVEKCEKTGGGRLLFGGTRSHEASERCVLDAFAAHFRLTNSLLASRHVKIVSKTQSFAYSISYTQDSKAIL